MNWSTSLVHFYNYPLSSDCSTKYDFNKIYYPKNAGKIIKENNVHYPQILPIHFQQKNKTLHNNYPYLIWTPDAGRFWYSIYFHGKLLFFLFGFCPLNSKEGSLRIIIDSYPSINLYVRMALLHGGQKDSNTSIKFIGRNPWCRCFKE